MVGIYWPFIMIAPISCKAALDQASNCLFVCLCLSLSISTATTLPLKEWQQLKTKIKTENVIHGTTFTSVLE